MGVLDPVCCSGSSRPTGFCSGGRGCAPGCGSAWRCWANYFRHAAAKRTFDYLGYYAWWRVGRWLRKKHPRLTWKQINRRYTSNDTFQAKGVALFNPGSISVTRYRYRGARIPDPWNIPPTADPSGLRTHRASREEQRSLGRVQQALA